MTFFARLLIYQIGINDLQLVLLEHIVLIFFFNIISLNTYVLDFYSEELSPSISHHFLSLLVYLSLSKFLMILSLQHLVSNILRLGVFLFLQLIRHFPRHGYPSLESAETILFLFIDARGGIYHGIRHCVHSTLNLSEVIEASLLSELNKFVFIVL
jgi:hypothetical protein